MYVYIISLYIHIYIYIFTYIHIYICAYMYIYIYICGVLNGDSMLRSTIELRAHDTKRDKAQTAIYV